MKYLVQTSLMILILVMINSCSEENKPVTDRLDVGMRFSDAKELIDRDFSEYHPRLSLSTVGDLNGKRVFQRIHLIHKSELFGLTLMIKEEKIYSISKHSPNEYSLRKDERKFIEVKSIVFKESGEVTESEIIEFDQEKSEEYTKKWLANQSDSEKNVCVVKWYELVTPLVDYQKLHSDRPILVFYNAFWSVHGAIAIKQMSDERFVDLFTEHRVLPLIANITDTNGDTYKEFMRIKPDEISVFCFSLSRPGKVAVWYRVNGVSSDDLYEFLKTELSK